MNAPDATAGAAEAGELRLARANRALRVISAGNRALLHAKGEEELARQMCRAIVEAGGYPMAWVGYVGEGADRRVRPAASWGAEPGYLESLAVGREDAASRRSPTSTAIRRGVAVAANHIPQTDANCGPWRKQAQRYGYPALLALPLRIDGRVIGALTICGADGDAFDAEIVELFGEAADDLAFGIASQRVQAEAERMRAALASAEEQEEAAKAQLRKLSLAVEQSPESIVITDLDGKIEYVNEAFVRNAGYAREEVLGRDPRILQSGKTARETYEGLWSALAAGRTWHGEFINRRKDGSEYVESAIVAPIFQADRRKSHYLAIKQDITENKRLAAELDRHRCHLEELVQQLRQLAVDTTLAEERERQAIARDLHDDLGQILHVAKIKLDALETAVPAAGDRVHEIDKLVADASARVRSLTSQLSPPVLATLGLVPALSWLAGEMQRSYGLAVEVEDDGAGSLTAAQSAILFRAVRELLINIAKHAGVASAHVDVYSEAGELVLAVADEGSGIADLQRALAGRQGFGLASVRERIAHLAGSVDISTTPGAGTVVTLRMPYDRAATGETAP